MSTGTQLQSTLERSAKSKNISAAEICYFADGAVHHAFVGGSALETSSDAQGYAARAGCLTKLMTGMVLARLSHDGRTTFDCRLIDLLDVGSIDAAQRQNLSRIELKHLLSHRHGLDCSAISAVPLRIDGTIDYRGLLRELLRWPNLARTEDTFCYGSGGHWLAGAIAEQLTGRRYSQLLFGLFRDAHLPGCDSASESCFDGVQICPATGASLKLSAADLLQLLRYLLSGGKVDGSQGGSLPTDYRMLWENSYVPAGVQWRHRKICLGLHEYEEGWYGHNAKMAGDSAVIRVCPRQNIAIAITASTDEGAYALLGSHFSHLLSEFVTQATPKFMPREDWMSSDASGHVGVYENASFSIHIDVAASKLLRAKVYRRSDLACEFPEPFVKRHMKPTVNGLFLSDPPEPLVIPYLEFVENGSGGIAHLQNGHQIFKRVDA